MDRPSLAVAISFIPLEDPYLSVSGSTYDIEVPGVENLFYRGIHPWDSFTIEIILSSVVIFTQIFSVEDIPGSIDSGISPASGEYTIRITGTDTKGLFATREYIDIQAI